MRSRDTQKLSIETTTYGRTQAELLLHRLESIADDIEEYQERCEQDDCEVGGLCCLSWMQFSQATKNMLSLLARQHLLEECE